MRFTTPTLLAAATLAMALAAPAQADIVNGGFETGDFTGWTQSGNTDYTGVAAGIGNGGTFGAAFGPDPVGSISQSLSTVAGATYAVSFWLALDSADLDNNFSWSWDGVEMGTISNSAGFDFTSFTALVTATGSSATLQFNFRDPAAFFRLDDVSVTVPEPGSAALAGLALVMAAGLGRKRHKQLG